MKKQNTSFLPAWHRQLISLVIFFLLSFQTWGQVYTTLTSGNWNSASTWVGGLIPSPDNSADRVINIRHEVNFNRPENLIKNYGTIQIQSIAGITAKLVMPSGSHFENYNTGKVYITNAQYSQYRFAGGGNSGTSQSGTFKNYGGVLRIVNSFIEVAQDWITETGGSRYFENSCLVTGQNYSNSGSPDTLINSKLSIGWHGSGSFDLSIGNIYSQNIAVVVAGTSGNFKLNSGTANGSINYITLKNPATGNVGSGEVFVSSSINNTPGLSLDAYCVSTGSKYIPNGKLSGARVYDCTVNPDIIDCMPQPYIPLPVKLLYFNAQHKKNNTVELKWGTTSEINVNHFVIERSYDGSGFSEAGIVSAYSNSSELKHYIFEDITHSGATIVYYRLRSVDTDNKFNYSETRIVKFFSAEAGNITIFSFPNPVSNELNITIPAGWQNKKVAYEILGSNGQVVSKTENANSTQTETINVSKLSPGLYIVRVICNGEAGRQKIIKH